MDSSPARFYFSNYQNPHIRKNLHTKVMTQNFEPSNINHWNKVLKSLIECAYNIYFEQRNVKILYNNNNMYNINNKLMLMRDSFNLNKNNSADILFFADIINLREYLEATQTFKKVWDRVYHTLHSVMGNSVKFYKYGIIYGFKINTELLKGDIDELFSNYNFNTVIFIDVSFLQTVYLLFRKMDDSYRTQRRDDKIVGNKVDHLDKAYGINENIQVVTSTLTFLTFAYVYNGSIVDSMTNNLLPPYAKKPIKQLKYGKTFVFSNYFMLSSKIYKMLNYKNLSLLCEYHTLASANFYSDKKVSQYIGRKFLPFTSYYLYLRFNGTIKLKTEISYKFFVGWKNDHSTFFIFYFFTNLYLDSGKLFHGGFGSVNKRTKATYFLRDLRTYYGVLNKYFIKFAGTELKEFTNLSPKKSIMKYLYDNNEDVMNNLRRYDMENILKNKMTTYVDDYLFFDDCCRNEKFLNERCNSCSVYEDSHEL
ncbi:cytoadherence linked asexual protein 3.2, putative [Plasmodium sp.]|nr:cytoadherence linked asexual protein 3.2, putative [Plasmodium sp.]